MTYDQYLLCDRIISRYDMKTYVSVIDAELSRERYNEYDIISEQCNMMMSDISEVLGVDILKKECDAVNRRITLLQKHSRITETGAKKAAAVAETVKSIGKMMLGKAPEAFGGAG